MSHNFQDFLSKQGFDIQEIHAITENVAWFSVCGSDEKYVIKYEKDRLKEQDDTEYQVQKYLYEK
ncbi:MAG: hypothetical protein U9Q15_05280 [Patescibacteria group bacterium]|nr:hypothetical protein [Patescibacteria group bacterium]